MTILYKSFDDLSDEQLKYIADMDAKIPIAWDPRYQWEPSFTNERYEYFKNLSGLKLAAMKENKVIGFHVLYLTEKAFAKIANISTFWVDPDFRRQGIGKGLKESGEKWARENQCDYMQTNVHRSNERMVEINQDAGFELSYLLMRKYLK